PRRLNIWFFPEYWLYQKSSGRRLKTKILQIFKNVCQVNMPVLMLKRSIIEFRHPSDCKIFLLPTTIRQKLNWHRQSQVPKSFTLWMEVSRTKNLPNTNS